MNLTALVFAVGALGCSARADTTVGVGLPSDAEPERWSDRGPSADVDAGDASIGNAEAGALVVEPGQFTIEQMPLRMLQDGDPIDLWPAPQGGHVVLIGAKVRHSTSEMVKLTVRIRHAPTNLILAEESRTVKLVPIPGEPDAMMPDTRFRSEVAHVPLCPDYDPFDIVDQSMNVAVTVEAPYQKPTQYGEARLTLVPSCAAAGDVENCRCECEANYFLGKCGRRKDASTPDADNDAGPEAGRARR